MRTYNAKGADFSQGLQWGGRRLATCFMSVEEEARLMKQLQSKALKGAILTFKDIKQAVEAKLGGQVSADYIWDLFRRNGWSKKAPRPKHPKQNAAAQQDFKKLPKLLAACWRDVKDKRPVKLFFEDEARFGRINNVSRCSGCRPAAEP